MTQPAARRWPFGLTMVSLLLLLAGVTGIGLAMGATPVGLDAFFDPDAASPIARTILFELRIPRVLLAIVIGAGLASAGAAYQSLFRNPLADPFVIGASSGAALGAAVAVLLGFDTTGLGLMPLPLAAFVGTLAAVAAVYGVGGVGARASPLTLLLAGAALSTILGAVVSLIMLFDEGGLQVVFVWLLGGLAGHSWGDLATATAYILPGLCVLQLLARPLDALSLGDEAARSFGLPVVRTQIVIIGAASLTTATAVAMGGIIGFVGLVAPHGMRLLLGSGHGRLLPATAIAGAVLLVMADTTARVVAAPIEVPVGIMTALMGGPFFLLLLRTRLVRAGGLG